MEQKEDTPVRKRVRKPKNQLPPKHPLFVINRAKEAGIKEVLVATSTGKDSVATLSLCFEHFERVQPFFMYYIKGLSFQQDYIRYLESRFGFKMIQIPDFRILKSIRGADLRHFTNQSRTMPALKMREAEHYVRMQTGIDWIASGETACESVQRQGMIRCCEGIDRPRGHIYPIGYWGPKDVISYLSTKGIRLTPEYRIFETGGSFGGIRIEHLVVLREKFPDEYRTKVLPLFPMAESQIARWYAEQERLAKNEQRTSEAD